MAETYKDMITVVFGERAYNLIYVPSNDCPVVEEKAKYIEDQLSLIQFGNEDILKLGELVQLAYFGVVGHTVLQGEVRPALNIVSDLCDDIIHTLNGVKRSLHGAIIRIQTVYEYLDNSHETNALQVLKELQPISQTLLQDSFSLSQKCFEKKNCFLKVHHAVEEKKQVVVDEAQKQKEQLSASIIEKFTCEILIKRSNKLISKENSQIIGFKKQKSKIIKDKEKVETKCKKELDSASKKHEEKLSNLKSKYDSSKAKSIKDSKKRQKKCDAQKFDSRENVSAAACMKSIRDQHNEVNEKLIQEKQYSPLVDENKGKPNENEISEDHQPTQSNYHQETNKTIPLDTDTVDANNASTVELTMSLSFNSSETQLTAVETKDRLQDTQKLQGSTLHSDHDEKAKDCGLMDTTKLQVEVVSTEKVSEKQEVVNDSKSPTVNNQENKVDSTAVTKNAATKGKEKTLEEQQEALLQEYLNNKQKIENKYQVETEKLDGKLEKLNQQLAASEEVIKDNNQKIKDIRQKIPELTKIIAEKEKVKDFIGTSLECICHVIAALYTVGSIIKKLGNFLRDFAKLCCQLLDDETLLMQIEHLQNEIWKSNTFKLVMLNYYGNCVAFTNMCNTAVEYITKAQEEVYQNVCKDLTTDEAFKLVQKNAPIILPQVELD